MRPRNPGDEDWRRLEREWVATGDAGTEAAYLAAWQRAGAPGRDPRWDPLPGDIVDVYTERRYSGRTGWSEVRRYEVAAVYVERCRAVSTVGAPAMCTLHTGHENERGGRFWHRWPAELGNAGFRPTVRRRLLGVVQPDGSATPSIDYATKAPFFPEDTIHLASWRAACRTTFEGRGPTLRGHDGAIVCRRMPGEPVTTSRRGRRSNPGDEELRRLKRLARLGDPAAIAGYAAAAARHDTRLPGPVAMDPGAWASHARTEGRRLREDGVVGWNPGDEGRRERERTARGYGGSDAEAARITDAMRSGAIHPQRVLWAAQLGDPVARTLVDRREWDDWGSSTEYPLIQGVAPLRIDPAVLRRPDQLTGITWRMENAWLGCEHPSQFLFAWSRNAIVRAIRGSGYVGRPHDDYVANSPAWHVGVALDELDEGRYAPACSSARLSLARSAEWAASTALRTEQEVEDAGTQAWAAELDAQFNDLIGLLLGSQP